MADEARRFLQDFVLPAGFGCVFRPRLVCLNPTENLYSTNPVFNLPLQTMIRSPNSPFGCQRRQGAQSKNRWTCVHHWAHRATLHGSRRHGLSYFGQRPVQPHRQLSCDGHLRHPTTATAKFQSLLVPPQFRIELRGRLGGFDQQVTHHRVALLIAPSRCLPPLLSSLGFRMR